MMITSEKDNVRTQQLPSNKLLNLLKKLKIQKEQIVQQKAQKWNFDFNQPSASVIRKMDNVHTYNEGEAVDEKRQYSQLSTMKD